MSGWNESISPEPSRVHVVRHRLGSRHYDNETFTVRGSPTSSGAQRCILNTLNASSVSALAPSDAVAARSSDLGGLSSVACERCKRIKKKCDRTFPECLLCRKACVPCYFPPDLSSLNARIQWLSSFIDGLMPPNVTVKSLSTDTNLNDFVKVRTSPAFETGGCPNITTSLVELTHQQSSHDFDWWKAPFHSNSSSGPRLAPIRNLPPGISHMDLFNEYFKLFHQSYPFLDRRTALAEAESWVHIFDKDTVDMDFRSLKLYLIMALGAEFFDRKRHAYTILDQFRVPYSDALQLCLSKPDMESIQILLLLAIYSTYDPSGWPPWIITSVLGRQAFALGLNHRIKAPFGSSLFETGTEFRYRLFWCIFCIDRWVSVAFGLPLAIDDNDYDVPFPSVTTAEFAALDQSDRLTTLQVARQVITMCELQGQTLSRVHIGGFRATSPDCPTRLRTIERFRAQAENWYTQGCLLARLDTQKPVHNTITWLNVIFHSALILLYYPSQANADLELELPEMLQIAQKYILCAYAHFQGGHLPLSHITLNSFWVVYRILVYCYSCHQAVTNTAETEDIIIRCVTMLDAFSPGWKKHVEPCRLLYCRFANLLRKAYPYIVREELSPTSNDDPLNCPENDNLDTIIKDSESMVRKVMGASSIYSNLTRQHER